MDKKLNFSNFNFNNKIPILKDNVAKHSDSQTGAYLLTFRDGEHLIFDCFIGSGTTAIACRELNLRVICVENNKEYFEIAKERIKIEVKNLLNSY